LSVLVVLDVDSTLIQQEVIELLANQIGVMPEVKKITDLAMAGEIDFKQSLEKRVSLLAGLSTAAFKLVRKEIQFTTGAKELVAAVHAVGGKVGAVSGGFTQILDVLAEEIGLDYWLANELEVSNGTLTGALVGEVIDAESKAVALRKWALDSQTPIEHTIAIGDGANDIQMLRAAGLAIAFRPKPVLREYADYVIEENSLLPVIEWLPLGSS
jgi:phosphoserine phosphatase